MTRSRWHRLRYLGALVAVTVAAACTAGSAPHTPSASSHGSTTLADGPIPATVRGVPREVVQARDDWPLPGQNYENARAASRSSITSRDVKGLKLAWTATPKGLGALSTAPVVTGDTVLLEGGSGEVVALDRATGRARWISPATGFNIGPFGVAIADGRVFADDGSTGVMALNLRTGAILWRHRITTTKTLGVDIQPTVFAGMVFAGTVPVSVQGIYAGGDRGVIYALDAATGKERWSFDTVKGGSLWGNATVNSGGGAWYPPAIDVVHRIIYFGTANPAPFPGTSSFPNGSSRPGANLYTDSVVALNVDTGKLLWYHQVTAHDIFDRDQVHTMLSHTRDGREILISAGKSGEVVALDPLDGKVIWQRAIGEHHNDDLTELTGATTVAPGTYGGVLTPPATAGGVAYFATLNAPIVLEPNSVSYFGAQLGKHDGEVVALDVATGKVIWDAKVPGDPLGATTVVNDLVFTALFDGTVLAIDRTDGRILWKYNAGGGINGWLSAVGDALFVPVGQANPPAVLALATSQP